MAYKLRKPEIAKNFAKSESDKIILKDNLTFKNTDQTWRITNYQDFEASGKY